jgi:hypothetical protein
MLLWQIYVAGNNETYVGLRWKCLIFLYVFNQICSLSTDFHRSGLYQISRNSSAGNRADTLRIDGHDEANTRFSPPRSHASSKHSEITARIPRTSLSLNFFINLILMCLAYKMDTVDETPIFKSSGTFRHVEW